ncbi:MAG: class II aldolase/adducin family protein [Deltaproteobacteria bacterium]|nr:class II aldolase/adducin family protein [Deltaproteobacteria bacterium]
MSNVFRERKEVAAYAALLHERGWVANHDGNVSLRLAGGRLLITPTGVSKRLCGPETLVECSPSGDPIGPGKAPSETGLHVGAYRARSDAAAVIHAHPPHASAYALCQVPLGPIGMPEVVVSLGEQVPMVPLFGPKDAGAGEALGQVLGSADVALLAGNGVVAIGPDLETAYLRIELLEHYARILTIARGRVGEPAPLTDGLREKLLDLRKKAGLHRGPVNTPIAAQGRSNLQDTLRNVVAEEVRRALGGKS